MRRREFLGLGLAGSLTLLAGCGTARGAAYVDGKLSMAVITTYGTGTSTYADVAAVANALADEADIRTRIMTSDTAIGRMTPLRQGLATFGRTGDEYIFALEATNEFLTREWGPQSTRLVWGPVAPHGLLVRQDSGIETLTDLAGKRLPDVTANPSVNGKIEMALVGAGLSRDDVEMVPISYGEQAEGLKQGKIDMLFQQVYGSSLYELESSTPVQWVKMDQNDQGLLQAIQEINPSLTLGPFSGAPGQEEGQEDIGFIYSIPIITYDETDTKTVQEFSQAIVDAFPRYENATKVTPDWHYDKAVTFPQQVPFHEGLIAVLEKLDKWSPEAQAKQDELLEREKKLKAGWKSIIDDTSDADLKDVWLEWKAQNLD